MIDFNFHTKRSQYLKKLGALTLVVLFATIIAQPLIPYANYILRKNYITEAHCVNKAAPEKQCNGKCHLEKQVKENSGETEPFDMPFAPDKENEEVLKYLAVNHEHAKHSLAQVAVETKYLRSYSFEFVPSIFHPPM